MVHLKFKGTVCQGIPLNTVQTNHIVFYSKGPKSNKLWWFHENNCSLQAANFWCKICSKLYEITSHHPYTLKIRNPICFVMPSLPTGDTFCYCCFNLTWFHKEIFLFAPTVGIQYIFSQKPNSSVT